jgi:hypothetical protein
MFAPTTSTLLSFQPMRADSTPDCFTIVPPIPMGTAAPDSILLIRDIPLRASGFKMNFGYARNAQENDAREERA